MKTKIKNLISLPGLFVTYLSVAWLNVDKLFVVKSLLAKP